MADWGQGLSGAAGGAMAGSAFGPVGTGIGAGIGGLLGLLGGDGGRGAQNQRLSGFYGDVSGQQAPQASGGGFTAANSPYESNRAALIAQLQAMSTGQGPSLANQQMQQAMDRSAGQQGSLAAGAAGRGVNPGAAYMNAANQTSAQNAATSQTGANARVQEEYNAQGLLSNTLGQAIGQNNQNSQFNAGQQQQVMLANLQAKLSTMGLDDSTKMAILNAMGGQQQPGLGQQIMAGGAMAGSYFAGAQGANKAAGGGQGGINGVPTGMTFGNGQGTTPYQPNYFVGGGNGGTGQGGPSQMPAADPYAGYTQSPAGWGF